MTGLLAALMSIGVIGAFALAAGGAWLLVRRRETKRGVLMLAAALVLFVNVLIWTVPGPG